MDLNGSLLRGLALLFATSLVSTLGCGLQRNKPEPQAAGTAGEAGGSTAGSGGGSASGGRSTSGGSSGRGGSSTSGAGGTLGGTAPGGDAGENSSGGGGCDAPNDCGGCGTLSAPVGEECGRCGSYECRPDGTDVTCVDSGLNACDGCGELGQDPGEPCGECGTYTCNAAGTEVTCVDPGLNECGGCGEIEVPPGTPCGACEPYECSADKSTTVCAGANVNECGGCGTLDAMPGTPCGECGTYTCSPDKSAVTCNDPGENACGGCGVLGASVGSPCGQCGTYECSSDKSSLTCSDPGFNACGGCGVLAAQPGSACGSCGNYACSADKSSVICAGDTTRVNCSNNAPQQCNASGQWTTGAACSGVTPHCVDGECHACKVASDCPAPQANGCLRAVCTANNTCEFAPQSSGTSCPAGGTCNSSGVCVRNPVTVAGFNIDATEVTVGQYAAFLAAKGGNTSGQPAYCSWNTSYQPTSNWPRAAEYNDMPVAWVDWCDAYAYCQWAGRRLCGKIGGGPNARSDYANPALSQWHRACTGSSNTLYPYGNTYSATRCNGAGAQIFTAIAVGEKTMCVGGHSGLFDMSGNVWEFEDSCTGSTGSSDLCRWRGGSYVQTNDDASGIFMQCDSDLNNARNVTDSSVGFRCCSN